MPRNHLPEIAPNEVNLIAAGTVIDGTLNADSDTRINGTILGQMHVKGRAIVAEPGTVKGTFLAEEATVSGAVEGDLMVEKKLILTATARVTGTIRASRLVVEEGACFNGECQMGEAGEAIRNALTVPLTSREAVEENALT